MLYRTKIRIAIFLACAFHGWPFCSAASTPTAAELQRAVLDERNSVTSGHMVLRSEYWENGTTIRKKWTVKFMGEKRLGEEEKEYPLSKSGKQKGTYTEVNCFGCFDNDMQVFHTDEVLDDGRTFALRISDPTAQDPTLTFIPDPRWIGLLPANVFLMRQYSMQSVIGSKAGKSAQVSDEVLAGVKCKKISFTGSAEETYQAWIVPSEGHSVKRIELRFTNSGKFYRDKVDCEYAQVGKDKKWFPSKCQFVREEGKKDALTPSMKENVAVDVISINEPLDNAVFSLQGIHTLKPGTPMVWVSKRQPPVGGAAQWDGSKLIAALQPSRTSRSASDGTRPFWLYLNLGIVFGIIALIIVRKRKAA